MTRAICGCAGLFWLILFVQPWSLLVNAASSTEAVQKTSTNARVTFPTNKPVINHIDVLEVSYVTNWTSTNMTLFCQVNEATWTWATFSAPLINQNGTYSLDPVIEKMTIPQFPVICHFDFRNYKNTNDYGLGGQFTMTSTTGPKTTWKQRQASGTSTNEVQTTAPGATNGMATSAEGMPANTGGTAENGSASASSSLSAGAAAGIGTGIGITVIAVAGIGFFIIRRRNQRRRNLKNVLNTETLEPKDSAPPYNYQDTKTFKSPVESDGQPVYVPQEMDARQQVSGHHNFIAELPTTPIDRRT